MKLNKVKKTLLGLGLVLSFASCSAATNGEQVKNENVQTKAVKENPVKESVAKFESVFGITTEFKIIEKLTEGMANPEVKIEAKSYNQDGKLVDLRKAFVNEETKKFFTEDIQKIVKQDKTGKYFNDAKVNLDDAVMILNGKNLIFVFPQYVLGPHSSGLLEFSYQLVK
ncbi:DUF3298 domain-containing protein [Oceanivirga miroungae]|uniref:Uncharacterized protein n=1 Tax=Oceanivirga miroungae TaxID=1130046 RepID=A0A6I8MA10_9FUSO|nr:DUF3298 domain-containing protein [Oceanivirga miroungae]VWL85659.1 hypothetical protein OMES3154_00944 [Oceanivirga miroungae]